MQYIVVLFFNEGKLWGRDIGEIKSYKGFETHTRKLKYIILLGSLLIFKPY